MSRKSSVTTLSAAAARRLRTEIAALLCTSPAAVVVTSLTQALASAGSGALAQGCNFSTANSAGDNNGNRRRTGEVRAFQSEVRATVNVITGSQSAAGTYSGALSLTNSPNGRRHRRLDQGATPNGGTTMNPIGDTASHDQPIVADGKNGGGNVKVHGNTTACQYTQAAAGCATGLKHSASCDSSALTLESWAKPRRRH